jgi:methyl-accepting chemotaxis protein
VVDSVRRVTDIMGEIANASQEQSAGIEQVNRSIIEMDGMTQQNAALVEEAAAAAQSLQDQAGELARVVSIFKLEAGEERAVIEAVSTAAKALPTTASVKAPVKAARKPAPAIAAKPASAKPSAKPSSTTSDKPKKAAAPAGADEWEEF